jgi:hypothetical protein
MKKIVSCLLVVTLICPALWSDPVPDQKHIDHIQKKIAAAVEQHRIVAIDTFDHRHFQGSVSEAQADRFVLMYQGRATMLN